MFSYRKVGGLRFFRAWRFGMSFWISREPGTRRQKETKEVRYEALTLDL